MPSPQRTRRQSLRRQRKKSLRLLLLQRLKPNPKRLPRKLPQPTMLQRLQR